MYQWKSNYKWIFSDLGAADKVGVNESGIGIFKRQPYKGLAKEILQNVTDAKNPNLPDDSPVRARFELIYVDRDDIPDVNRLNEVIHKCYQYYSDGDDGEKLKLIQDAADKYLESSGKIPVLKISDYNTTGLRGVKDEKGSNWTGLVRERSATNKSNGYSGAFGIGKFAPYNFSDLRTILYSTKTINGETAFQGKSLLTTFKENGKLKQNIGLFADENSENYDAVFSVDEIAPVFRRETEGTDIFVLGFKREDSWIEQSAISVIEYFFYSIYRGKLEVEIAEADKVVAINQDNLGRMISYYDDYYIKNMKDDPSFQFTAPSYWKLLSGPHKVIKNNFVYNKKSMGEYELYLLTGDDISEKKVLEMRQAGMKIREDSAFRIPINFIGIFIATGAGARSEEPKDNISSFLRKCENQAHDDWAADEYKEEKDKAKGIINKIHSIILEEVKKEMPDFGDKAVDAFGLSEFLLNEEDDDNNKEEKAFSDFRPLSFEIQNVKSGKKRRMADISMKKRGASKRKKKGKDEEQEKGKGTEKDKDKDKERKKKYGDNKKENDIGKATEIFISRIKTPYDAIRGEYRISFIIDEKADNLMLGIRLGSDDDNLSKAEIAKATLNGKKLAIKNGMIELGAAKKGEKRILQVKLTESTRKTLEVRAYVKR